MFGNGAGINYLVLVTISSNSDNGLDGGLYTRILIIIIWNVYFYN